MTKISDGQSLYLITRNGRGYWSYNFRDGASYRTKLLGSAADVSPSQARQAREKMAVERRNGRTVERRGAAIRRANPGPATASGKLFGEVVTEFLDGAAVNWRRTLTRNGLATVPVADVDTPDVEKHLKQWADKPATAEKARLRIHTILDFAKVRGYRDGENPARLKGHFQHIPRPKAPEVERHPAMPSAEVPAFMASFWHSTRQTREPSRSLF